MQIGRVLLAVALVAGATASSVAACGGESGSSFDDSVPDSGVEEPTPGFKTEAGSDASLFTCHPSLPGTFKPTWKAPVKANACTSDELGDYFDACLSNQVPDAGSPCDQFREEHAACASCLEPEDNSGPIQWHRDRYYYTLNVAGCMALELGQSEPGQCPATYAASIQCQREACGGCFESEGATFTDFSNCQARAKTDVCGGYEGKIGPACGTGYKEPDGGAVACFRQESDADQKEHFVRVEGIFCGP